MTSKKTGEILRKRMMKSKIPQQEINEKVEQFIKELKTSDYSVKQAKDITISGIQGWKNRQNKRKRDNSSFYRLAEHTLASRVKKDLIERENWYKTENTPVSMEESNTNSIMEGRIPKISWKRGKKRLQRITGEKKEVKSVIFIPHTKGSELATQLRDRETRLQEVTGDKVKITERAGRKLENILTGKDPWKGKDCGRSNCFLCTTKVLTGKDLNKDCTKRNILYEIRCLSCEQQELERIELEADGDENKKKDLLSHVEIPKYISVRAVDQLMNEGLTLRPAGHPKQQVTHAQAHVRQT